MRIIFLLLLPIHIYCQDLVVTRFDNLDIHTTTMSGNISNLYNVKLSTTGGEIAYISFPDGSSFNSAYEVLPISTMTILSGYSTTQTTGYKCISGSTLTITSNYIRSYLILFDGTLLSTKNTDAHLSPIIDGRLINVGAGLNPYKTFKVNSSQEFSASYSLVTYPLPAGTHTFCISLWINSGTISIPNPYPAQFSVIAH